MSHVDGRYIGASPATAPTSKRVLAGRIISAVPILFMIFDGAIKIPKIQPVIDASAQLGLPIELAPGIGILALVCTAIYAFPRTSVLGAVLLTGYLGGAVATQLRAGTGLFNLFFPFIIGALVWGGLYLRDQRLRSFLPFR